MRKNKKRFTVLGVIPARYNSKRLKGKPLIKLGDKTMIQLVYEQAKKSKMDDVIIATDNYKIIDHVVEFNGNARLTSKKHKSGTERLIEIAELYPDYDAYINIQGDEPFIDPKDLDKIIKAIKLNPDKIITMCSNLDGLTEMLDRNTVKVNLTRDKLAAQFTRSVLYRNTDNCYKHIGIYGFSTEILNKISKLKQSKNENIEKLEQLRWMDYGIPIYTIHTDKPSIGIDVPHDISRAREFLNNGN